MLSFGAMVRTIVSLQEEDKAWLERRAREEGVSMAEMVRRAVRQMRVSGAEAPSTADLLASTAGMRRGEDGLVVQRRLRDEWRH